MYSNLTTEQLAQVKEILAILQQKFPKTFFSEARKIRPLKVGIHRDLYTVLSDQYSRRAINRTLRFYTKHPDYLNSLTLKAQRIDLAGNPADEVLQEHIEISKQAKQKQQVNQHNIFEQTSIPRKVACLYGNANKLKLPEREKLGLKPHTQHSNVKQLKIHVETLSEKNVQVAKKQPIPKQNVLDQLTKGGMEIRLKINVLPDEVKTIKHGWQQFIIQTDRYFVQVTIRPRAWKKLQETADCLPHWVANITGKMGPWLKGNGFELLNPITQIFESKPTEIDKT